MALAGKGGVCVASRQVMRIWLSTFRHYTCSAVRGSRANSEQFCGSFGGRPIIFGSLEWEVRVSSNRPHHLWNVRVRIQAPQPASRSIRRRRATIAEVPRNAEFLRLMGVSELRNRRLRGQLLPKVSALACWNSQIRETSDRDWVRTTPRGSACRLLAPEAFGRFWRQRLFRTPARADRLSDALLASRRVKHMIIIA